MKKQDWLAGMLMAGALLVGCENVEEPVDTVVEQEVQEEEVVEVDNQAQEEVEKLQKLQQEAVAMQEEIETLRKALDEERAKAPAVEVKKEVEYVYVPKTEYVYIPKTEYVEVEKEVIKEVPVEVIKEVEKEVIKEVEKEVIVEVPVEVEKPLDKNEEPKQEAPKEDVGQEDKDIPQFPTEEDMNTPKPPVDKEPIQKPQEPEVQIPEIEQPIEPSVPEQPQQPQEPEVEKESFQVFINFFDITTGEQFVVWHDIVSVEEGKPYNVTELVNFEMEGFVQVRIEGEPIGIMGHGDVTINVYYEPQQPQQPEVEKPVEPEVPEVPEQPETPEQPDVPEVIEPEIPQELQNAIQVAKSYVRDTHISKQFLVIMLEEEGFTNEIAQQASDSITVDWNKEALDQAESYIHSCNISKQLLQEMLQTDYFTDAQVNYAMSNIGNVDWNSEALAAAKEYVGFTFTGYSEKGLAEELLTVDKFTQAEVDYAMNNIGKVNWSVEAHESAKQYLELFPDTTKNEMREFLKAEKFTDGQITFALRQIWG